MERGNPRSIIHQITSGIAGWLTYEQMRDGDTYLSEYSLYVPILEIARGRAFEVRPQFPVEMAPGQRGAPSTIDFLIVDRRARLAILLEIKFKRANRAMAGSLTNDAIKLFRVKRQSIDRQILAGQAYPIAGSIADFKTTRAVMFLWKGANVSSVIRNEHVVLQRQFFQLVSRALKDVGMPTIANVNMCFREAALSRQIGSPLGSIRSGSTIMRQRFWVASLIATPEWTNLTDL